MEETPVFRIHNILPAADMDLGFKFMSLESPGNSQAARLTYKMVGRSIFMGFWEEA